MVYLGYTIVYILCKRGLVDSDTSPPLEKESSCGFPPLVCSNSSLYECVYLKIKNVYSQCFLTLKKRSAQLEVLLFISVSIVNQ